MSDRPPRPRAVPTTAAIPNTPAIPRAKEPPTSIAARRLRQASTKSGTATSTPEGRLKSRQNSAERRQLPSALPAPRSPPRQSMPASGIPRTQQTGQSYSAMPPTPADGYIRALAARSDSARRSNPQKEKKPRPSRPDSAAAIAGITHSPAGSTPDKADKKSPPSADRIHAWQSADTKTCRSAPKSQATHNEDRTGRQILGERIAVNQDRIRMQERQERRCHR